jgi:hypothetical protein
MHGPGIGPQAVSAFSDVAVLFGTEHDGQRIRRGMRNHSGFRICLRLVSFPDNKYRFAEPDPVPRPQPANGDLILVQWFRL